MFLIYVDIFYLCFGVWVWQRGCMLDVCFLFYDFLMVIKLENFILNVWVLWVKVSCSFFIDVCDGIMLKMSILEKVLSVIGYSMVQFYELFNVVMVVFILVFVVFEFLKQWFLFIVLGEFLDVLFMGMVQVSDMEVLEEGVISFVECMDFSLYNVVDYVRWLVLFVNCCEVYVIMVVGDSMVDWFWEGDLVYVDFKCQFYGGDFVVVQFCNGDDDVYFVLLKKFVKCMFQEIELEQMNLVVCFIVLICDVVVVYWVIFWNEIVFF